MARRTKKKLHATIQANLPQLITPATTTTTPPSANPELNAILAQVFRIFAARGRAIREAREKEQAKSP